LVVSSSVNCPEESNVAEKSGKENAPGCSTVDCQLQNDQCNIVEEVVKSAVTTEGTADACAVEHHDQNVVKEVLKSDDGALDTRTVECDGQNDIHYTVEKGQSKDDALIEGIVQSSEQKGKL